MRILDALHDILLKAGKPLHYDELTKRAIAGGWQPGGPTPENTVNSRLSTDIRKKGRNSRFVRAEPGVYGLRRRDSGQVSPGPSRDTSKARKKLSFLDAAEQVLRESGGKPMHYGKELWPAVEQRGLVDTSGQTPANTLYVQVLQDVSRRNARGLKQRFARYKGGYIGLAGGSGRGSEVTSRLGKTPTKGLGSLKPEELESLVGELLTAMGYDQVRVTPATRDRGVDVSGQRPLEGGESLKVNVQVKHWKAKVQAPDVQKIRGASSGREECAIVTSSDYSAGAYREANRLDMKGVKLINGDCLMELLARYGVRPGG
jgi:restriction system protein